MVSAAPSAQLERFLKNLAADPGLLEAFEQDRETILEDVELSAEDRHYLLTVSIAELRAQLPPADGGIEPQMGG